MQGSREGRGRTSKGRAGLGKVYASLGEGPRKSGVRVGGRLTKSVLILNYGECSMSGYYRSRLRHGKSRSNYLY